MADIDPIDISLVLKGIPEAKKALTSIRDLMVKIEVDSIKASETASKKRIKNFQSELQQKQKMQSSASKKVDSHFSSITGGSSGGGRKGGGASGGPESFMKLTGLDKSVSGMSKFGSVAGVAAAGVLAGAMALKAGFDIAVDALSQFGSFVLSDVVKPAFALETFATQVENTTKGEVSAQQVMDKTRAIQVKYNIDAMEAAEAAASFGDKTGSVATGLEVLNDVAPMVKAFGGNLKESMDSAAALFNKMKEIDPKASMDDVRKLLLAQLGQGQVEGGKFTAKELANLGGELTKGAGALSGGAGKRLSDISAALQAGGITGKADVSMSALNSFLTEMPVLAKSGKIQGAKGTINKQGQITDISEAIKKVLIASKGDQTKLRGMGFGEGSSSFLAQFMPTFQEAVKSGKDPKQAADEAIAVLEKIRNASASEAQVKEAAAKVAQTSGEKWDAAVNQIKDKLLEIMPQIGDLVDEFVKLAPDIAEAGLLVAKAFLAVIDYMKPMFKLLGIAMPTSETKPIAEEGTGKRVSEEEGEFFGEHLIGPPKPEDYPPLPKEALPPVEQATPSASNVSKEESGKSDVLDTLQGFGGATGVLAKFTQAIIKASDAADDSARKKPLSER